MGGGLSDRDGSQFLPNERHEPFNRVRFWLTVVPAVAEVLRLGARSHRQIYLVKGPVPGPVVEFDKQRERMRLDLSSR